MEKQRPKLKGSIYLSIKELMILTGKNSYKSAQRGHQAIRDSIIVGKKKLTVKEYCEFEGINKIEVINFINNFRQQFL